MSGHDHSHLPAGKSPAYSLAVALNLIFVLTEVGFGLRVHSLALLSDAGHNLSDVLGLGLAWGAAILAQSPPTQRHTYGLRRATILAALANAVLLLVAVGGIVWEALQRIHHPRAVAGNTVMMVAGAGVVINGLTALLFLGNRHRDVNVRGAFLHMAADSAVSLGVVIAGLLMVRTGWLWLDSAVGLGIGVVIVWGTWGLLNESFGLAMDAVPKGVKLEDIAQYLTFQAGVAAIHDLHVWAMSTTETALTVHLVSPHGHFDDARLAQLTVEMRERFGIAHSTIQVERGDGECGQAPSEVV